MEHNKSIKVQRLLRSNAPTKLNMEWNHTITYDLPFVKTEGNYTTNKNKYRLRVLNKIVAQPKV